MMVKTLDRYVIRTFLESLFGSIVVFLALRVVLDLFVNLDEFTEEDVTFLQLMGNIGSYYFYNVFAYFIEMGGIVIAFSAAFCIARMNHTNELTAMLASGVSLHRVVWPIILFAMLMGGMIVVDQEFIVPNIKHKLVRQHDEVAAKRNTYAVNMLLDPDQTVWYASMFEEADKSDDGTGLLYNPMAILREGKNYRYLAHIVGQRARVPGTEITDRDKSHYWVFEDANISRLATGDDDVWRAVQSTDRVFSEIGPEELYLQAKRQKEAHGERLPVARTGESLVLREPESFDSHFHMTIKPQKFIPGPAQPVTNDATGQEEMHIISGELQEPLFEFTTPDGRVLATIIADKAVWVHGPLQERHWRLTRGRILYETRLTGEDIKIRSTSHWLDYLSSGQLTELLRIPGMVDPVAVRLAKYVRFAEPLNNLILLLLVLPFILSRQRNLKASAALAVLFGMSFFAFIYIARYIGLGDFLGAFLPVLLFGPTAVLMLDSIKT